MFKSKSINELYLCIVCIYNCSILYHRHHYSPSLHTMQNRNASNATKRKEREKKEKTKKIEPHRHLFYSLIFFYVHVNPIQNSPSLVCNIKDGAQMCCCMSLVGVHLFIHSLVIHIHNFVCSPLVKLLNHFFYCNHTLSIHVL